MKKIYYLFALMFFAVQPVLANEAITSNIKYALKRSTDGSYFSVVIALAVVILLIYITGIIYAKLNVLGYKTLKKQYKDIDDSKIIIRSTTQIGNNKTLHVIELAGKKMLIGVTNDSINLIKDLDEKNSERVVTSQDNLTKELSKSLPLDKIYPQGQEIQEEIKIDKEIPEDSEEDDSTYNSEEFGLYKKYLD